MMAIRTHCLLFFVLVWAGFLASGLVAVRVTMAMGIDFFAQQPLWVILTPLVGLPTASFVLVFWIMGRVPAKCQNCGGRAYWCKRGWRFNYRCRDCSHSQDA